MKELPKRMLVACLVIGPAFLLPLWFGGIALLLFVMLISAGLVWEFRKFSSNLLPQYQILSILILCWVWNVGIFLCYPYPISILFGSLLILFLCEIPFGEISGAIQRIAVSVFLLVYAGILPSSFILVRRYGAFWAILPIAMVWTVDTFAYWGGSLMGKHKLAENLSPKKTVEGFFWGLGSAFTVAVVAVIIKPDVDGLSVWLTALIAGTAGQIGDLFESKIKRQFKIKDTSSLFPGHGGIWDRTDSLLWVYPTVWLVLIMNGF